MHKKPTREVSGPILWGLLGPLPPLQNLLEMKRKL
jgi:hypothetical protein